MELLMELPTDYRFGVYYEGYLWEFWRDGEDGNGGEFWVMHSEPREITVAATKALWDEMHAIWRMLCMKTYGEIDPKIFVEKILGLYESP